MAPIITLLTDFGTRDTYVGQVKGVILARNSHALLVDLTHEVAPQQVLEGAFLLEIALGAFPLGTIHLAVVDPGVGSTRRAIAIAARDAWFVGPDNGLLSAALPDAARPRYGAPSLARLPNGVTAVELVNPALRRPVVSHTFHGRDIFGPAAAHLSLGVPLARLGPAVDSVVALPPFRARHSAAGSLDATVVSIDRFGNVITDCRAEDLPAGKFVAWCNDRAAPGPARAYAEAGGLAALVGSAGFLEIAAPGGNAAAEVQARIGDAVRIVPDGE